MLRAELACLLHQGRWGRGAERANDRPFGMECTFLGVRARVCAGARVRVCARVCTWRTRMSKVRLGIVRRKNLQKEGDLKPVPRQNSSRGVGGVGGGRQGAPLGKRSRARLGGGADASPWRYMRIASSRRDPRSWARSRDTSSCSSPASQGSPGGRSSSLLLLTRREEADRGSPGQPSATGRKQCTKCILDLLMVSMRASCQRERDLLQCSDVWYLLSSD